MNLDLLGSSVLDKRIRLTIKKHKDAGTLDYLASRIGGGIAGGAATLLEIENENEISVVDQGMFLIYYAQDGR